MFSREPKQRALPTCCACSAPADGPELWDMRWCATCGADAMTASPTAGEVTATAPDGDVELLHMAGDFTRGWRQLKPGAFLRAYQAWARQWIAERKRGAA